VQSNSFIVWTTPLLQGLMTRMLGGRDPASDDSATYSMTRIQHRLLSKLNDLLLLELSSLLRTDLSIAEVRENSSVLQQPIATSFSIWISFELNCGGARGVIHLGIPRMAFDCQMSSPESKPATMASNTDSNAESIPGGIRQVTVKVSASLAKTRLRTSDLATLQVGDILMTDLPASGPILLSLEGQDLCQAAIGTHSGHKALRLLHSPIYRNSNPDH
jgi:flagellar motor switch protein FliM